ncbi:MAG TPA: Shedu immune nuclease family protein [Candidatus Limnocylindria bacterium]|nr:Shedu immune nuclease family protein [Candidatus Limnocylindria bacterium]
MKPRKPYETIAKDLKTKTVYEYIDERNNIRVKSREVFKTREQVIHYPFRRDGQPKYPVKRFVFKDMPDELQRGFSTAPGRGYGFTRILSRLANVLFEDRQLEELVISPNLPSVIGPTRIVINAKRLDQEFPKLSALFDRHSKELNIQAAVSLSSLFPADFKPPKVKYVGGGLGAYIHRSKITPEMLSAGDVDAILGLAQKTAQDNLLDNEGAVLRTRERIEEFYIEAVIEEFEELLKQKTETDGLEEKWQKFFKKYNWIFSQLFTSAVLFFQDKAYVGGKGIDNKKGKVTDFIYKNKFTDNVAIIEIKTHRTPLLKKQIYRGNDVFAADKELSGATNQVLDQRDNLQKEFYNLRSNSEEAFEAYNPKCVVVAGMLKGMSAKQRKSFELLRSNSKDVEIVTFDEVLHKLKGLRQIIMGDKAKG